MTYVLVVEDSPVEQKLLRRVLQQKGLTVQIAHDGLDAIDKIKIQIPSLVITDIEMPRMNGYNLCHWLKSNSTTTHIPIAVCSSHREPWRYFRALEIGVEVYLTKPINVTRVFDVVRQLLQKSIVD